MARALLRFRKPDVSFWIQDYHFLTLAPSCASSAFNRRSVLPAHAGADARDLRQRAAPSGTGRGDAGL